MRTSAADAAESREVPGAGELAEEQKYSVAEAVDHIGDAVPYFDRHLLQDISAAWQLSSYYPGGLRLLVVGE